MSGALALLNLALLVVVLAANGLANALPINGRTTGAISDSFPLVFVPAGYVFAIWGLIYLALIAHVVYGLTATGRADPRMGATRGWLQLNFAANAGWILCWHYGQYPLSLALMLTILVSLKAIHHRLDVVERTSALHGLTSLRAYWLTRFPMSLYQGWISVATIANVSVVLLNAGWNGGPATPEAWALLMVAAALALNLVMVARLRDFAFGAVGIWALVGIAVKRSIDYPTVAAAANFAVLLIGVAMLATLAWSLRQTGRGTATA